MARPSQNEIARLQRFYEKAVRQLARLLRENLDLTQIGRVRTLVLMQQAKKILDDLDAFSSRWARRNIERLYNAAVKDTRREMLAAGFSRTAVSVQRFALLNRAAIDALLVDPQNGFLASLKGATSEIRNRLQTIRNQAKLLRAQQAAFDETIARVGILEGQNLNTVRDQIVSDMLRLKSSSELIFPGRKFGADSILKNIANLPYIRFQTATGERMIRVDDYASLLARTKTKQAVGLARRHTLIQHGGKLVRVSLNRPLQDDACWLYLGKVFALTEEARKEYGVPHVRELPSGGTPFHPNCTHDERAFFPQFRTEEEIELGFERPPAWALNRPWGVVQREYKRRGGKVAAIKVNRAAAKFSKTTGGRERRRDEAGLPEAEGLTAQEELKREGL